MIYLYDLYDLFIWLFRNAKKTENYKKPSHSSKAASVVVFAKNSTDCKGARLVQISNSKRLRLCFVIISNKS